MDMVSFTVTTGFEDEVASPFGSDGQTLLPTEIAPDPEPGWATRHPDRAMLFLYVSPRPCAAIDELLQL